MVLMQRCYSGRAGTVNGEVETRRGKKALSTVMFLELKSMKNLKL